MKILFSEKAWIDYLHWQSTDKKVLKRINILVRDISRDPYKGPGKPEPLKYKYKGSWSRRIDSEHRLIYQVMGEEIHILKCRYHYE
ncbi:MAG: Txe/YoeB family addiction module toxin [Bacteroides sp.]|nr:Txe/YoeB family addiction module toxin [Bacteroides sp.]